MFLIRSNLAKLLGCGLLLLQAQAYAEWTFFSSVNGDTVLLDKRSLVQSKNRYSTIWMLTNFGSPTAQDVLSVSKLVEFDCDRELVREHTGWVVRTL